MSNTGHLSAADQKLMSDSLKTVLSEYKSGKISEDSLVASLLHVMVALDIENTREAVRWFENDGDFFKKSR